MILLRRGISLTENNNFELLKFSMSIKYRFATNHRVLEMKIGVVLPSLAHASYLVQFTNLGILFLYTKPLFSISQHCWF